MVQITHSNGIEMAVLETPGIKVAMDIGSLNEHIRKHPGIAVTPEGYLHTAADILTTGKPYKNGFVGNGIFVGGYNSPVEMPGCFIVRTVHRKF